MTGTIFDIKEFSLHDGPGARTTVFFKGCPLRCAWCHNPEGLESRPQLLIKNDLCTHCGRCKGSCDHPECRPFSRCLHACPQGLISVSGVTLTAQELTEKLKKNLDFYTATEGGITFSGGEPLMQSDFLLETIDLLNCHTAIQTSGYASPEVFRAVMQKVNYVMMDLKIADSTLHKKYTGVDNELILKNFLWLKQSGTPFIVRTPLIAGICDTKENLEKLSEIIGYSCWEQLPENAFWKSKYPMLSN